MRRPTGRKIAHSPSIYSKDWGVRPSFAFAAVCKRKSVRQALDTTTYLGFLTAQAEYDRNATKPMIRQLLEKTKKAEFRAGLPRKPEWRKERQRRRSVRVRRRRLRVTGVSTNMRRRARGILRQWRTSRPCQMSRERKHLSARSA